MRISVVLCVYNGERFLREQLESIARQDRPPDELIVADDGSTDGSLRLVETFATRTSFPVRPVRNRVNLGVAQNFAQAIGLAEGDLIVAADQDDVWFPGKLDRIEAEFQRSPDVGLVCSDAELIDADGNRLGSRLWPSVRFGKAAQRRLVEEDPFRVLLRRPVITGATMAFRSDLRGLILPIAPGWIHDEWIGLMVASVARIAAIPESLMLYRRHAQNQVGVLGLDVAGRTKATLSRPQAVLLDRAEGFERLREALAERLPEPGDLLARLDQKIAHDRARGRLPKARLRRLPIIFRELATLGYSRYSGHTWSFLRDLLAKG